MRAETPPGAQGAAAQPSSGNSGVRIHEHIDCGWRERVWLPKEHVAAATAARHPYCVACGTVKNLAQPRGKSIWFFLNGIALLKECLEHSASRAKLAQVQSHLIAKRLAAMPEFEDPYGTPGEVQLNSYVSVVRAVRPDLDEELILRMTPGRRRTRRVTERKETPRRIPFAARSRH